MQSRQVLVLNGKIQFLSRNLNSIKDSNRFSQRSQSPDSYRDESYYLNLCVLCAFRVLCG
jgi:hypothetical protein